jgi:hypothetical protein
MRRSNVPLEVDKDRDTSQRPSEGDMLSIEALATPIERVKAAAPFRRSSSIWARNSLDHPLQLRATPDTLGHRAELGDDFDSLFFAIGARFLNTCCGNTSQRLSTFSS